jgi:tetratricopeptide (TPR) repeat protein
LLIVTIFIMNKQVRSSPEHGWPARPLVRLSLILWLALVLVWLGFLAFQVLQVNLWSLRYLHAQADGTSLALPAPQQHPRAALWTARQALDRGLPALARLLVADLAQQADPPALLLLGEALAAQGEFAAAVEAWSQAGAFYALQSAAAAARDAGHPADALLALRAAYRVDIQKGIGPLAKFLWDSGTAQEKDEALALLSHAWSHYPEADQVQRLVWAYLLATYLQQQNRWDAAEAVYLDVLEQAPQAWQAKLGLGWVYYQRGDGLPAALNTFQQVNGMQPARGVGYLAMAQVLVREAEYDQADALFALALDLETQQETWWLAWGNALRTGGRLPRAIQVYTQAVQIFPASPSVYYELAWAYQLSGDGQKAVETIQKALTLPGPPSDACYARAGYIYEHSGDALQAVVAYRQALALNPLNQAAQQGLQRLEQE